MRYDIELRKSLEEQILSSLINNSKLYFTKKHALSSDIFKTYNHKLIYSAIVKAADDFKSVDLTSIGQSIKNIGDNKISTQDIISIISQSENYKGKRFDVMCEKLYEYNDSDRITDLANKIINSDKENLKDFSLFVNNCKIDMTKVGDSLDISGVSLQQSVDDTINAIMARMKSTSNFNGVNTGIDSLNDFTNGWLYPDLVLLAGRPAMGKTAFAIANAGVIALNGDSCAFYSYEMPSSQLLERIAADMTKINSKKMLVGDLSESEFRMVNEALVRIKETNLIIKDEPLSLSKLINSIRYEYLKNNIKIAFIDYAQLVPNDMVGSNSNDEAKIGGISQALKRLALEIKIPIILLSQLSRAVESRPTKIPRLSDLRGSGSLEQDADIIMMFFRPAYYNIPMVGYFNNGKNLCRGLIVKGRRIGVTELDFWYNLKTNSFKNWNNEESPY